MSLNSIPFTCALLAVHEIPTSISKFATSQVELGKLFLADGEARTFIEQNQASLKAIDESLTDCWMKIAQNPQEAIQRARYLECVACSIRVLPLVNVILTISSVIGLTASGVATVVVLTPLMGALTAAALEHTQWAAAKEAISKINSYLVAVKIAGVFAIFSTNQFLTDGIEAGVLYFSKIFAGSVALLLLFKYVISPLMGEHGASPFDFSEYARGEVKLLGELKSLFEALKTMEDCKATQTELVQKQAYLEQLKKVEGMCKELDKKVQSFSLSSNHSISVKDFCRKTQLKTGMELKKLELEIELERIRG